MKLTTKLGICMIAAPVVMAASLGLGGLAHAKASPDTVNLTELYTVDGVDYPVCSEEDCSDQPGQVGLWLDEDTGNWWLSRGEGSSLLVIDDTAR